MVNLEATINHKISQITLRFYTDLKGKIPSEQLKALNAADDRNVSNHVVGDVYNNPISIYTIKQADQKVFVLCLQATAGDVGVVQLAD